jgi:hypothetical protein
MKRTTVTKETARYRTADWRACSRVAYAKAARVDHIVPLEEGGTDDDANEALQIRVTGLASKTIRWHAVVDTSEVSAGTPS